MEKQVLEFTASDEAGTVYRLYVYQNFIPAGTRGDPTAVIAGLKRIVTENGDSVNRLEQGEYEIVQTGVVLRSSDANAP